MMAVLGLVLLHVLSQVVLEKRLSAMQGRETNVWWGSPRTLARIWTALLSPDFWRHDGRLLVAVGAVHVLTTLTLLGVLFVTLLGDLPLDL